MIEIYDLDDVSFLKEYQSFFQNNHVEVDEKHPVKKHVHASFIENQSLAISFLNNYNAIYEDWIRLQEFRFMFKLEPDKPTMWPHIDFEPKDCTRLRSRVKRILVYANEIWDDSWGGGTYFSPFEAYECTHRYTPRTSKKVFIENATRVENKPGRAVIFDVDEYHLPQEFSGNTHPRFIYGGLLIRSDSMDLIEKLEVPNAKTGRAVIGLK